MEEIIFESTRKLKRIKSKIEKSLDIKLEILRDKVLIESVNEDALSEYIGKKVLEAIDFGFDANIALHLKSEDFMFEKIHLKSYTRQTRLRAVLGRMIGKNGRAIKTMSELSECSIKISDYDIGVIGNTDDVDVCMAALKKLIHGAPHSKVYAFLERNRALKREKLDIDEEVIGKIK